MPCGVGARPAGVATIRAAPVCSTGIPPLVEVGALRRCSRPPRASGLGLGSGVSSWCAHHDGAGAREERGELPAIARSARTEARRRCANRNHDWNDTPGDLWSRAGRRRSRLLSLLAQATRQPTRSARPLRGARGGAPSGSAAAARVRRATGRGPIELSIPHGAGHRDRLLHSCATSCERRKGISVATWSSTTGFSRKKPLPIGWWTRRAAVLSCRRGVAP